MATLLTREEYLKDKRTPCKYGFKCYQKNPTHHEKFKHPPKPTAKPATKNDNDINQAEKKIKLDIKDTSSTEELNDKEKENQENGSKIEKKQTSESSSSSLLSKDQSESQSTIDKSMEEPDLDEDDKLLDNASFIEKKFLVKMPDDFFKFWDLCKEIRPDNPVNAFKDVNLKLVGPYDVLAGKFANVSKSSQDYLIHWRYYYDPPEFQTIIKGDDKIGYHMGYFRDSPQELPVFVASNNANKDYEIKAIGGNVFGAVNTYLEDFKKTCDPFKKLTVTKLQNKLKTDAEKLNLDLSSRTDSMRLRRTLARTFHRAGIVVPYDRKTQLGYRPLAATEKELQKIFSIISSGSEEQKQNFMSVLTPIITATDIANDECDFGTGLEFGLDCFSAGIDALNATALRFLKTAYMLLNRNEFGNIAEAHLKNRKKGTNLSVL